MNTVIHILCLEWSGWLADISLPPIAGSEVRWYVWTCHFCCTLDCWSLISIYAFSILQYQLELVGTWLWWQVKQIPKVEVCTWVLIKKTRQIMYAGLNLRKKVHFFEGGSSVLIKAKVSFLSHKYFFYYTIETWRPVQIGYPEAGNFLITACFWG